MLKKKSNEKIRRNYRKTGSQDKYQSLNWFGFSSTIYETVSLITINGALTKLSFNLVHEIIK